jgi:DNA polymerase I-like protein with 3'-5' exonuclease and polymerase domains
MVIGSAYGGTGVAYLINPSDMESFLSHHSRCSIILHNAPFDVDVIEKTAGSGKFYPFYDSKRIWDTGILYRLYYLATKGYVPRRYNLNLLSEEYFNETLDKGVRMDFAPYLNKTNELTNELKSYAALDAVATYYIYKRLRQLISPLDSSQTTLSHHIQTRGDLALNRLYKRGIGFDLKRRDLWLKAAHKRLNGYAGRLANWGWVRGKKGNNDVFESILRHIGIYDLLPRTETGAVSSKETDLKDYRYIEFIDDFLNYQELEKQITFIADQTEERVHPRYDLLKETGRTSCKSPNFQQLPRKGMIRSMYKAKPGHTFIITDYSSLELATLAQTCLDTTQPALFTKKRKKTSLKTRDSLQKYQTLPFLLI